MGFKCGIVGLPNVGKSTLFNSLVRSKLADAANFPFCTVDPNVGIVEVPDARLSTLKQLVKPERLVSATVEFVDIAGLVRGASTGEGLGNQFLGHIREVQAIVHVVRCFQDENVIHVDGAPDPIRDVETIDTELCLADLSTLEKRIERVKKSAKAGTSKELQFEVATLERAHGTLSAGHPLRKEKWNSDEAALLRASFFLTFKPTVYVANVSEEELGKASEQPLVIRLLERARSEGAEVVPISARLEEQLIDLAPKEGKSYLESLNVSEPGLDRLIQAGYKILGLITYFTAGEKEVRAWTVKAGSTAPQAAGVIHSDFERGFIKADVVSYADFVATGGWSGAKEKGLLRIEGKAYTVSDGDVMLFRFAT